MRQDNRVIELNKYVNKLESELIRVTSANIKLQEVLIELNTKRKRLYENILKGKQLEPVTKEDAEYRLDGINAELSGLAQTIYQERQTITELEKKRGKAS